jgi:single-strand DNA-binding protein
MNKVFLSGKIGRDPEIKQTNSGLAICNFSLATSESVKKGDKWEKETEWHNVVVFGGRGEYIYNNATKGSGIVLTGRIKTETWEKNGEKKSKVVIIAEDIDITSARNETSR